MNCMYISSEIQRIARGRECHSYILRKVAELLLHRQDVGRALRRRVLLREQLRVLEFFDACFSEVVDTLFPRKGALKLCLGLRLQVELLLLKHLLSLSFVNDDKVK